MFTLDQYELCDFGDGRKLERFGGVLVDRPCLAAAGVAPACPELWELAALRFERNDERGNAGVWRTNEAVSADWRAAHKSLRFELRPTPAGQVGLFPEQAAQWDWVFEQARAAGPALAALNLFAYTGGSTLAAAAAGARVAHVDASKTCVAWARRNAERSGLATAKIRWIHEDALAFVRRELKRGSHYRAAILDPPSYGHGPGGQPWHIERGLAELLASLAELTRTDRRFVLLTCHTPGLGPGELQTMLARALGEPRARVEAGEQALVAANGRRLPSGAFARWEPRG